MKPLKPHSLPVEAERIIREQNAPPRLVAHLTLVHDVAERLVDALLKKWPDLPVNREHVLLGAALHDLGKVVHSNELTGPGKLHEAAGEKLLLQLRVSAEVARFARTHGQCAGGLPLEDLLVKTADMIWKGQRIDEIEQALVVKLAAQCGIEMYESFSIVDRVLSKLAQDSDKRLEWQATFA